MNKERFLENELMPRREGVVNPFQPCEPSLGVSSDLRSETFKGCLSINPRIGIIFLPKKIFVF